MAKSKVKPKADIQEIYAILLARGYQEELFRDLPGQRRKEKGGQETLADCPLCQKPGHFSYASREPLWRCWSCQQGGDWLDYLQKAKRLDFREALHFLADAAGVEISGGDSQAYQAYTRRASLLEAAQELFIRELFSSESLQVGSMVILLSKQGDILSHPVKVTDIKEEFGDYWYQTEGTATYYPQAQIQPVSPAGQVQDYLLARGYSLPEWQVMGLGCYTSRDELQKALLHQGYSRQEIQGSGLLTKHLGDTHQLTLLWRDAAGRAIGIAARSILPPDELKAKGLPKYLYSYGLEKSQGLVGLASARGEEQLILVEGPLDALYLQAHGLKAVAMGGTALSPSQVKALQANRTQEIILALDRDEPGQMATEKAIQILRLSELRAYVLSLPPGYKDPDELVRAEGVEAFQDCLQQAERWPAWMARRIVSRQDISTDRGMDKALDEALELMAGLVDSLERRSFQEALEASTGLSAEELSQRAEKAAQRASQRASQQAVQEVLSSVQQKASQGDILGAEQELEDGLQRLRTVRGVEAPEAYLLEDLEADILASREGLHTGYRSLDSILKIPQGALTIVAGRPGHGKTTLLLNLLASQLSLYPSRAFYFFSYEEGRRNLALKLIMLKAGQMLSQDFNLEAHLNYFQEKRGQNQAIERAIQEYHQLTEAGRLLFSDSMPRAEDLAATIGWLARRGEIGAVYVDYIQKIPLRQPLQQRYVEIKRVSELLLQQAVQQDIPIILGAQLGRATGQKSKVTLDNLRESGDIEQDSSLVLGLYNEAVDKAEEEEQPIQAREVPLKIVVLKNRTGVAGRSKMLSFDRPILKIQERDTAGLL